MDSYILGKAANSINPMTLVHIIKYSIFINFKPHWPLPPPEFQKLEQPKQRHAISKCNWLGKLPRFCVYYYYFCLLLLWGFWTEVINGAKRDSLFELYWGKLRVQKFIGYGVKFSIKTFAVFQFCHFQDKSTKAILQRVESKWVRERVSEGCGWEDK